MTDASQTDATAEDDRYEPASEAELRDMRIEFRHQQRMEAQLEDQPEEELLERCEEFWPFD